MKSYTTIFIVVLSTCQSQGSKIPSDRTGWMMHGTGDSNSITLKTHIRPYHRNIVVMILSYIVKLKSFTSVT